MQNEASTSRQLRFAVFLQSLAAILLTGAGIVRWNAFGFDLWAAVLILAGLGGATAATFLVRAIRRT
ncbi:MAG: hypothetical protein F2923_06905 [Actinobacteria bacterium]|uniref:Unannotated protein n=1 Tax=freshwater metagenome TaxID=449393 RepID=A0A6J7H8K5_9ZZZZ|nr:hypothetical protein [Actinomycetota bacterium]MTB28355.1 hypothetical protein [Actinomycetota bacterium]